MKIKEKLFLFLSIALIVAGLALIAGKLYGYHKAKEGYDALREHYVSDGKHRKIKEIPDSEAEEQPKPIDVWSESYPEPPVIDWDGLKKEMPDLVAWISVLPADISYPVVQGESNAEYLHQSSAGGYSVSGSIFLDAENKNDFSDWHNIIYGHNMRDGSMFASFNKISEEAIKSNPYIWICTPDVSIAYQIVSVHTAITEGETFTLFHGTPGTEFVKWATNETEKSWFHLDIPDKFKWKVLTLSTCTPSSNEYRTVLQAYELKEYISSS